MDSARPVRSRPSHAGQRRDRAPARRGRVGVGWDTALDQTWSALWAVSTSDAEVVNRSREWALVAVLTARRERVDHLADTLFPDLIESTRASVSNTAGWAAGRTAVDLAGLDARESFAQRAG